MIDTQLIVGRAGLQETALAHSEGSVSQATGFQRVATSHRVTAKSAIVRLTVAAGRARTFRSATAWILSKRSVTTFDIRASSAFTGSQKYAARDTTQVTATPPDNRDEADAALVGCDLRLGKGDVHWHTVMRDSTVAHPGCTRSPIDSMLFLCLLMAAIIIDVQVKAGSGQRCMAEIVAHQTKIDALVRHVRTSRMPEPVRGRFLEEVGPSCRGLIAVPNPSGRTREHVFHNRVECRAG